MVTNYGKRHKGSQIVWEVETGREVLRNSRVRNAPNVAFSADEKQVAAFIAPDGLRVWDVDAGRVSLNLERLDKVFGDVFTLAFSPSEPVLATAGQLKGIALRDTRTGRVVREFGEMAGQIAVVAFSPDGKRLASVGWRDGKIRIWEVSSGRELAAIAELPNLDLSPNEPCSLRFAPNGKMLVLEWGRATESWFADDWKQPAGGADAKNGPAQARPNNPPQGRQPAK